MDDLTDKITKMLSDPETMEQIKGLAGMLGQNDAAQEPSGALPAAASNGQDGSAESSKGGGFDLSALSGLLSNTADGKKGGGPDLSALSGLLSNTADGKKGGGPDLSALSGLLSGVPGGKKSGGLPGAGDLLSGLSGDTIQSIMRILPMLSEVNKEDDTTRLLNALRPFLGSDRRKKLDESAKMLHMMKLLPLLKGLQL